MVFSSRNGGHTWGLRMSCLSRKEEEILWHSSHSFSFCLFLSFEWEPSKTSDHHPCCEWKKYPWGVMLFARLELGTTWSWSLDVRKSSFSATDKTWYSFRAKSTAVDKKMSGVSWRLQHSQGSSVLCLWTSPVDLLASDGYLCPLFSDSNMPRIFEGDSWFICSFSDVVFLSSLCLIWSSFSLLERRLFTWYYLHFYLKMPWRLESKMWKPLCLTDDPKNACYLSFLETKTFSCHSL